MKTRVRGWVAAALAAGSGLNSARAVDLFVVPARYSVVQVMFDVISLRPSGFVTYQGNANAQAPALHAWNGTEWVRIPLASLADGSFAEIRPDRVIVIGDADTLPPVVVEHAQQLSPNVLNWQAMDNASIVNAAGRVLGFSSREWSWIAGRYNMGMRDRNEERRRDSWYFHPHPDFRGRPPAPRLREHAAPEPPVADAIAPEPETPPVPTETVPPPPPLEEMRVEPAAAFSPNAMWEPPAEAAPAQPGIK